jgi:hypothetical protein
MSTEIDRSYSPDNGSVIANLLLAAFWLILNVVRWLCLVVLAFLEPFVRLLLSAVALLSVLAGLVYLGSSVAPPIPFWVTLCVALGCLILMAVYESVLYMLSR